MKKIFTLTALGLAFSTFVGCGEQGDVKSYLRDKYDKDFVVLDTYSSADGNGVLSHNFTAYCAPEDDPDCIFRTTIKGADPKSASYEDEYAGAVLSRRMKSNAEKIIGDYFEDYSVGCYFFRNNNNIKLQDMNNITAEKFFKGIDGDYPDQKSGSIVGAVVVNINADKCNSTDYEGEYDLWVDVMKSVCDEFKIDTDIFVSFDPQILYDRTLDWSKTHPAMVAMPTSSYQYDDNTDIKFEFYQIGWDRLNNEPSELYSAKPVSKDEYVAKRRQNK